MGASFLGISADHPLAKQLEKHNREISAFNQECRQMSTSAADMEKAEKKGIDTGLRVKHPLDPTWELPVWIANFILMDYGTGAIFACPAHDQRDLDFAQKYSLPVIDTFGLNDDNIVSDTAYIPPKSEKVKWVNHFTDIDIAKDGKQLIRQLILRRKISGEKYNKLQIKSWGLSRQRYWSCPIPVVHCEICGVVPEKKKIYLFLFQMMLHLMFQVI